MVEIIHTKTAKGYYTVSYLFGEAITPARSSEMQKRIEDKEISKIPTPLICELRSLIPLPRETMQDLHVEMTVDVRLKIPDGINAFMLQWTRPVGKWSTPQEYAELPTEVVWESYFAFGDDVDEEEIVDYLHTEGKILNDPEKGVMCFIYKFTDDGKKLIEGHSLILSDEEKERLKKESIKWRNRLYRVPERR